MIAKNRFSSILSLIVILFSFNSCNEVFSEKTVSPINTQLVFVDSEDIVVDGKLVYPVVNGEPAIGNRCSEIIDLSFLDDNDEKNAASVTKVFAVPRGEEQSIEAWIDSCRLAGINEVKAPYFRAVFISENEISRGVFIGDYTPSSYKPKEYIAKLNKDAYKERNNTPLQINDVEITYHCEGTAANVTVTFEPLADTLKCNLIYQILLCRNDINIRKQQYGYQRTCIVPNQTKFEFYICPDYISKDLDAYDRITDIAIVGVTEADSLKISNTFDVFGFGLSGRLSYFFGEADNHGNYFIADSYDHRATFWQKLFINRDLSVAWLNIIIAIVLGFIAYNKLIEK